MSSFRVHTLKVIRNVGQYDDGEWVMADLSTLTNEFNIQASVQPLKASEMQMLPEGRRNSKSFHVFTDTDLFPTKDQNATVSDEVEYENEKYEVLSCAKWNNGVIPHNDAVVVLKNA